MRTLGGLAILMAGLALFAVALAGCIDDAVDSDKPVKKTRAVKKDLVPFPAEQATATVSGVVKYAGEIPATPKKLAVNEQDAFCYARKDAVVDESLTGDPAAGTLGNVFVYISSDNVKSWGYADYTGANDDTQVVRVSQDGCKYIPHVFGITTTQTLRVECPDNTLHNVHFRSAGNGDWNVSQRMGAVDNFTGKFFVQEVGSASLSCDVHGWMGSKILITEHPFYCVTGKDGTFSIGKLPAGDYTVTAWHEKLGVQTQPVALADGQSMTLEFNFPK